MSGVEKTYWVRDENFRSRNEWVIVRIPRDRSGRVEVRPRTTPNVKAWAELPDRSLTFARATKGGARGKWYCPVALADPTRARSRDIVRRDERDELPRWFDQLKSRMRLKEKVVATKVWVLKERFALPV